MQGAALVLENEAGRILAMAGGFSYPASQLNRVVQSLRQPGSTLKPLTYLAALRKGLQPNTLVMDEPITLAPIGATVSARQRGFWSPKNYDGGASGAITLRRALENSRNLATVQLLATGLDDSAERGLDRVCELAMESQLYKECMRYYPFVLGAQAVRLIDLAAFYAAIAMKAHGPSPMRSKRSNRTAAQRPARSACGVLDRLRRPRIVLPVEIDAAGRARARNRARGEASVALRRRQDRHHR